MRYGFKDGRPEETNSCFIIAMLEAATSDMVIKSLVAISILENSVSNCLEGFGLESQKKYYKLHVCLLSARS